MNVTGTSYNGWTASLSKVKIGDGMVGHTGKTLFLRWLFGMCKLIWRVREKTFLASCLKDTSGSLGKDSCVAHTIFLRVCAELSEYPAPGYSASRCCKRVRRRVTVSIAQRQRNMSREGTNGEI